MPENKPTICFFNSTKTWGGGEKWHKDIATRLQQRGHRVMVVTNRKSKLFCRLRQSNITTHQIKVGNLSFLNLIKIIRIARLLKQQKVKAIIMNLPADLKMAGLAARLAGVPHIIYRRGSAIPIKNKWSNRILFGRVVTAVIANSEETKRCILHHNSKLIASERIHVIYNGIDIQEFDSLPGDSIYQRQTEEIILGNVGRMVEQKGQDMLLQIARLLKQRNINFKLLIGGDGKLRSRLEKRVEEWHLEEEVIFMGFVKNVRAFMQTIDIFLLTSLWEGFGYVLVEAMACQKPVLAYGISSNPEIVKDGESGYLVEFKNTLAFTEKLERLIGDEVLRKKMGKTGRKRVEELFSIEQTLKKIEQLLDI